MSSQWRIGEILEAPDVDELRPLAENHDVCEVVVFDKQVGGRVTLRLTVLAFELSDSDAGSTWPKATVQYARAGNASLTQLKRYPSQFLAEQIHNFRGEFDHGTMNAL